MSSTVVNQNIGNFNSSANMQQTMDTLETEIHNIMQTMRYKMHTLLRHWKSAESTNTAAPLQWMRIFDSHLYRLNQTLDNALTTHDLEFSQAEYQEFEREYHQAITGPIIATNPLWLSILALISSASQSSTSNFPASDTRSTATITSSPPALRVDNDPDFSNDYEADMASLDGIEVDDMGSHCVINIPESESEPELEHEVHLGQDPEWDYGWWADWEMVVPMSSHAIKAINGGKIKID